MIRLNEKGVRAYMAGGGARYRLRKDWQSRTGTIVRYNRNRTMAYVIWDGTRSCDLVPVNLIESVAETV